MNPTGNVNNTPAATSMVSALWQAVRADLKAACPADIFENWFAPLQCASVEGANITLWVASDFVGMWLEDNYGDLLVRTFTGHLGQPATITYAIAPAPEVPADVLPAANTANTAQPARHFSMQTEDEFDAASNTRSPFGNTSGNSNATGSRSSESTPLASHRRRPAKTQGKDRFLINPRNTFENFVVGAGSQMAHACTMAVAKAPAQLYNPLFLYGDTGLGKTHLMHAVAHEILNNRPNAEVAYVTTEKFTNSFIRALQEGTLVQFRKRYRRVDVLLLDDVHFLSGKERIQEEMFHTFNELYESQKQIILCSDRPANEIAKLESRLVSRFGWGMVADIQAPDLETRQAILEKKARAMKLELSPEILEFLAAKISRNVRRMEGALTRVGTYKSFSKAPLDIATVTRLLQDLLQEEVSQQLSVDRIQKRVADHYQMSLSDMSSKRRPAHIVLPRQIAMYLSRVLTSKSLQEIGHHFGGRDHGTVIHACKQVENMMEQDEAIRNAVDYLKSQLASA